MPNKGGCAESRNNEDDRDADLPAQSACAPKKGSQPEAGAGGPIGICIGQAPAAPLTGNRKMTGAAGADNDCSSLRTDSCLLARSSRAGFLCVTMQLSDWTAGGWPTLQHVYACFENLDIVWARYARFHNEWNASHA
jgi:hypothetical protein